MKIITLDTEQEECLLLGLQTAQGFLRARIRRADPEGLLSQSFELQALKLDQVRYALAQPPLATWAKLPDTHKKVIADLAEQLHRRRDVAQAEVVYDALTMAIIAPRNHADGESENPILQELKERRQAMAQDEKGRPGR